MQGDTTYSPLHWLIGLLIALGFWLVTQAYWVPSARNNDANAYILGGRSLAEGHWRGVTPADPFVFYGQHWVMPKSGRYVLKFPIGLPLLYATIRWLGGAANWPGDAYQLSPILAALAVWGTYLLIRDVTDGFYAFLGALVLAASPETLFYAEKPNSHAASLCAVVWGMFFVLRWWRTRATWQGALGGFVLGFDFTVRYTEGLMLLPLLLAVIFANRRTPSPGNPGEGWGEGFVKNRSFQGPHPDALPDYRERGKRGKRLALVPLFAWLVLVGAQTIYNYSVLHHFSGYGLTNESTAFSLHYFLIYWSTILDGLYNQCLYFLLPLSVLGAVLMLATDWRLGLVIAAWFVPPLMLYTAYYWSPEDGGPATLPYLRFLITILPALVLTAMWLMDQLGNRLGQHGARLAAGVIVAVAIVNEFNLSNVALAQLQWNSLGGQLVADAAKQIIPPGSSIFAEGHDMVLLEEIGDWRTYADDLFTVNSIAPLGRVNINEPQELQPARARAIYTLLGGLSDSALVAWQNGLMRQAISSGHGVYAILPADVCRRFCERYVNGRGFAAHTILTWRMDGKWETQFAAPSVTMQLIAIVRN